MDMDENNNNDQNHQEEETLEMTVPPVKNLDPKLFVAVVILILTAVSIVITMLSRSKNAEPSPSTDTVSEKVSVEEGLDALPPDLPKDIPLEEEAIFTQNSANDIGEGKMHSIISFNSNESVSKNYIMYKQYLTDTGWNISNASEGEGDMGSSLYAYKLDQEMNVTIAPAINGAMAQSMVIISMIDSAR
jgi:hypothetical protein